MSVLHFSTLSADHLTGLLAAEDTIEQVFSCCGLQSCLKPVEEDVEELLCVFLFGSVCGLSIELLEREAEAKRVVIHSLRELQIGEQTLHLMEHVVVADTTPVLHGLLRLTVLHTE